MSRSELELELVAVHEEIAENQRQRALLDQEYQHQQMCRTELLRLIGGKTLIAVQD